MSKDKTLKLKFGISLEDYNNLLKRQNYCCRGCGKAQESFKHPLGVDHCHVTGKVRGLLCTSCNVALGMAQDSSTLLRQLANYLDANRHLDNFDMSLPQFWEYNTHQNEL